MAAVVLWPTQWCRSVCQTCLTRISLHGGCGSAINTMVLICMKDMLDTHIAAWRLWFRDQHNGVDLYEKNAWHARRCMAAAFFAPNMIMLACIQIARARKHYGGCTYACTPILGCRLPRGFAKQRTHNSHVMHVRSAAAVRTLT